MKTLSLFLLALFIPHALSCASAPPQTPQKQDSMPKNTLSYFSLSRLTGNHMAEGSRNSTYYYLSTKKIVIEVTDLDCDEKSSITPEQFAELEVQLIALIERYKLKEWTPPPPPEFYPTDEINSFRIDIKYADGEKISINSYPKHYQSIMADLAVIFAPYMK